MCACGVRMVILAHVSMQYWLSFLHATLYKHIPVSEDVSVAEERLEEQEDKSQIVSEGIRLQMSSTPLLLLKALNLFFFSYIHKH